MSCIGERNEGGRDGAKDDKLPQSRTEIDPPSQSDAKPESQCARSVSGLGMQPESMHPSKEGFLSEEGRRTVAADGRKFIIRPSSLDPSDCCSSSSVPRLRFPPTSPGKELGAHKGGASA